MINSKDILKFINGDHSKSDEIEIYLKELLTLRTINQIPYSSSLKSNNDIVDIESLSYFNIITLLIGISQRKINSKKDFNNIFSKEIRPLINLLRLDIPEHYGLLILYNLCNGNERIANLYMNFYIAGKEHWWEFRETLDDNNDTSFFFYDYDEEVKQDSEDYLHENKYLNSDNWTEGYINFYLNQDIGTFLLEISDIKLLISLADETKWEDPFVFLKYKTFGYYKMSLIDNLVDIVNGEKLKIDLLNININNWFEICDKLLQLKNINSDEVKYIYNYFFLYSFMSNNHYNNKNNLVIEIVKRSYWLNTKNEQKHETTVELFLNNMNYMNKNIILFSFNELYNILASVGFMSLMEVNYISELVFEIVNNYDSRSNSSKLIINKKELLFTGFIKYLTR